MQISKGTELPILKKITLRMKATKYTLENGERPDTDWWLKELSLALEEKKKLVRAELELYSDYKDDFDFGRRDGLWKALMILDDEDPKFID